MKKETAVVVSVLLLMVVMPLAVSYARAQLIPLPPPFTSNSPEESSKIMPNDKVPPKIVILTKELHEGKNVFKVKISDDSGVPIREVKYMQNGHLKVQSLLRDQRDNDDVYAALIDIHPPSQVITVTAEDAGGNKSAVSIEYDIKPAPNLLMQIMDGLSQILSYIQNLLRSK